MRAKHETCARGHRVSSAHEPWLNLNLQHVFELLVTQLQGIESTDDKLYERRVFLIERLAYPATFCLMNDPLRCDDLIQQLFETLFNSAR